MGYVFLAGSLIFDGLTGPAQEHIQEKYSPSFLYVMLHTNLWASVYMFIGMAIFSFLFSLSLSLSLFSFLFSLFFFLSHFQYGIGLIITGQTEPAVAFCAQHTEIVWL